MSTLTPIELMPTQPSRLPAPAPPGPALARGSLIASRYVIGAVGGRGAMGIVHVAWDQRLGRKVALKVLRSDLASDPVLTERFTNEARLAATLESPNVVKVYDSGRLPSGEPFIVTEWLEGRTLADVLSARGRLPVLEAVDLVIDACAGLADAHARGIVHRDVKPENLIVCGEPGRRSTLKVVDFGISKRLTAEPALTHAGDSLGSPCYMSPEQATESAYVDARSDVWSLGVVLFELLTGRRPFDGDSIAEVFAAILSEPAPSVRASRPDVDRGLEAVIWRCLEKDPACRFKNAEALRQSLTLFGSEGAHAAVVIGTDVADDPLPPLPKRSTRGLWLGLALAAGVLALAVWSVAGRDLQRPRVFAEPELAPEPADGAPVVAAFEPRFEPVRGIYAERAARDASGRALRAEAERETAHAVWSEGNEAATWADDVAGRWVPVKDVSVLEQRKFVNGQLVESQSKILEPQDTPRGETDAEH